ncbi:MAG: recombinase family protein [Methylobacteriaceae bacterium]|nr:recombinase family protein [Methylobacteriaceae bacterium]
MTSTPDSTHQISKVRFAGYRRSACTSAASHARQTQEIEAYASKVGLQRAHDDFVDVGKSGLTTVDRDGFNALMQAVAQNLIDVVVVDDLTRLSRNTADVATYIKFMKQHGVELHCTQWDKPEEATAMLCVLLVPSSN